LQFADPVEPRLTVKAAGNNDVLSDGEIAGERWDPIDEDTEDFGDACARVNEFLMLGIDRWNFLDAIHTYLTATARRSNWRRQKKLNLIFRGMKEII
jgi:hypothetical protein